MPTPILLLHGNPGSSRGFDGLRAALSEAGLESHAYTLPGFGGQPPPPDNRYDLAAQADGVADRMKAEGLDRAVVLGHSHGGSIALVLAGRHPDRVAGLCLCGSAGLAHGTYVLMSLPGLEHVMPLVGNVVDELELEVDLAKALAKWGMGKHKRAIDPAQLTPLTGDALVASFATAKAWDPAAIRAVLPPACPVTIVHGRDDKTVPLHEIRELARALPGHKFVLLKNVGHSPHLDAPGKVIDALAVLAG